MDVTKPYKFIWFGDIDGPKPYEFIGSSGFYFANTGLSSLKPIASSLAPCSPGLAAEPGLYGDVVPAPVSGTGL
jgi:hypothetical protein